MTNPLDKSLQKMRAESEGKDPRVEESVAEDESLDEYGERIAQAYRLSGEPPSLAAIEWAEATVDLPPSSPAENARFKNAVRERIEARLAERTGALSIGGWIKRARSAAAVSERDAAQQAGLQLPAYRLLESDRMPVWRAPAGRFAALCHRLAIDAETMVRWASLRAQSVAGAAYGRMDVEGDKRAEILDSVAGDSERAAQREFEEWRDEFIAAYAASSEDDARSER